MGVTGGGDVDPAGSAALSAGIPWSLGDIALNQCLYLPYTVFTSTSGLGITLRYLFPLMHWLHI